MDIKSKNYTYFKSTKIIVAIIAILSISLATAILGYSCSDNVSSLEPIIEAKYINSDEHLKEVWDTMDKVHVYRNPHLNEILYYSEDSNGIGYSNVYSYDEPFISEAVYNYINNFGDSNIDMYKFIKSFNTHYIINQNYGIEYGANSNKDFKEKSQSGYYKIDNIYKYNERLYVAFTDKYINQKQEQWTQSRNVSINILILFIFVTVVSIICLLWLIYAIGIDNESEDIVLYKIDYIRTDIILIIGILLTILWTIIIKEFMPKSYINDSTTWFTAFFDFAITIIFSSILVTILLSIARRFKAGTIIENSTMYTIFNKKETKKLKHHRFYKSLFIRQIVFVFLETLILGLLPITMYYLATDGLIITIIAVILIALIYMILNVKSFKDVEILVEHIDQIYTGNLEYKSTMSNKSLLYDSSKKLENIGDGLQKSVEQQIKNEKMKMDLITNVSHDLKTPLTSIISYIDLLSKEKNISEEERDYIRILAQKSDSLKNIVADLFDLAKVTSGNSEIKLEKIDMNKLIIQTLADMEDKIDDSKYIIKTILPDFPAYVLADGKKMYRVFQNIIDNALKYSLARTRIFIESKIIDNKVNINIKNTASYEMNFTEDEILERFSRGDKSRTTEGNGLGLSISQSFTQACGGKFKISIDGDQFKVNISFDVEQ